MYLAGPDVFYPQPARHFDVLEARLREYGITGVRPADNDIEKLPQVSKPEQARRLYLQNLLILDSCDAVLANLEPFRNDLEPDSGTCFEVGYAVAKGKPVVALVANSQSTRAQIEQACGVDALLSTPNCLYDAKFNRLIEDFDLPVNLMLACSAHIVGNLEEAIAALSKVAQRT